MTILAHAGHWAVQLSYFLPVVAFLAWLGWTTMKERRRDGDEPHSKPPLRRTGNGE